MNQELPKGYLKPLAKIVGPLAIWMAAGWLIYSFLMIEISNSIGETVDAGEIELFSYITAPAFLIGGIVLIIYGYRGQEVADNEFTKLNPKSWHCSNCMEKMPPGSEKCSKCGKFVER